ncbi:MAG: ABC transporter permease [Clostridia bacterium]|nr:ABC transporter permease [Clostridia bacterium]
MKSYLGLVPRYLKKQYKRSVLTIVGIILSVALITATGVIGATLKQNLIESTKIISGPQHAAFVNLDHRQHNLLKSYAKVEKAGGNIFAGVLKREDINFTMGIEGCDTEMIEMAGRTFIKGGFPKGKGEIALEEWALEELSIKPVIGQKVRLKFMASKEVNHVKSSETEAEFILAGILKTQSRSMGAAYSFVSIDTVYEIFPKANPNYGMLVQVKEGLPIRETLEEIRQNLKLNEDQVQYNESLLMALGENKDILLVQIFLALIIIIATVAAVYNIFNISVLERIKQFGLLRSVGTTPKQIRRIVFGEGVFLSLVSIPLGIGLGIALVYLLAGGMSTLVMVPNEVVIPIGVILGTAGLSLAAVLFSAVRPAFLAGKVTPLEAVRMNTAFMKQSMIIKPRKWHKWIGRLWGIGGKLAYLNLLRHKKRFVATTFSMCIGIVLFIVFSYLIWGANPTKVLDGVFFGDYVLNIDGETKADQPDAAKSIGKIKGVSEVFKTSVGVVDILFKEQDINANYKSMLSKKHNIKLEKDKETGLYTDTAAFYGYSENALKAANQHLIEGKIDMDKMAKEDEVFIINHSKVENGLQISNVKIGDEIKIRTALLENDKLQPGAVRKLKVAGILSDKPVPIQFNVMGISIVAHENTFKRHGGMRLMSQYNINLSKDAERVQAANALRTLSRNIENSRLVSLEEEIKKLKEQKRQISILLYGLIGIIALIGIFSIVNTISTNLILRVREFGVLRAVGMTNQELKQMVRMEGMFYGMISAIWGVIVGSIFAYILYRLIRKEATYLVWQIPWQAILIACAGSILLGLLATVVPTKRISSMNIIDSIKSAE